MSLFKFYRKIILDDITVSREHALIKFSNKKQIKAYIGFDCTAPSLHVGSLMQIMVLRLLQKYGIYVVPFPMC